MLRHIPKKGRPIVAIAAGLLTIVLVSWIWMLSSDRPLSNIRVEGVAIPTDKPLKTFLESRAKAWERQRIAVEVGYYRWNPTRAELGARRRVEPVVSKVLDLGRSGNPYRDLSQWIQSKTDGFELPWVPAIDRTKVQNYINWIRERVERPPTASTHGVSGDLIPGQHGEILDSTAIRVMVNSLRRGRDRIRLVTSVIKPLATRTFDDPYGEANQVLQRSQTCYSMGNSGRRTNIELAAHMLNNQVILPGASLSFNQVVGERSTQRGFAVAKEIRNRQIVDGIGGGVCQVATTLHSSALLAGLAIDEYRPHSRFNPFSYVDVGLDAMVAWPDKDLVVRNTYPFPIVVRTKYGPGTCPYKNQGNKGVLEVSLLGAGRSYYVEIEVEQLETIQPKVERRSDPGSMIGTEKKIRASKPGYVFLRTRTIVTPTGRIPETKKIVYRPVDGIVMVGTSPI